jgi:protease IV
MPPIPPPPASQRPSGGRTRWWIPVAIIGGLLALFVVVLGVFVGLIATSISTEEKSVTVRDHSVLMLDLSGGVPEFSPAMTMPFSNTKRGSSLRDMLEAIDQAADDPKIEGIYYRAGGDGVGFAKLDELRDALVAFKKSGKFIYAFIETGSKSHYYIASVADSIFMPQEGMLEFTAFGTSAPFMKGLFDKLGVEWHVQQFEEYKSAAETMSRTNWSEPAKQEVRELIRQRQDMFVDAVATSRKLERQTVVNHLDSGLITAEELLAAKLIDAISLENDLRDRVNKRLDHDNKDVKRGKMRSVTVSQYLHRANDGEQDLLADKRIAIVYASGAISNGKNDDPFSSDGIYPKNLIADLRRAADDEDVDGIVLRIDSPGGSVIGSEEIWSEIMQIRAKKPIYASMSDVAASGGYYIAMACDTIIAHPATITGSIGVILAMPNVSGTMNKIGVTVDTISLGSSANAMSPMMPYSDNFKRRIRSISEPIYKRFVQKVADARKKGFEETRAVAKGRVWTGDAALKAGLIDATGGLQDAIAMMKKRIGAKGDEEVDIVTFPEDVDQLTAILKLLGIGEKDEDMGQASVPAVVNRLMDNAVADRSTAAQVYKSLPPSMQQQLRHAATMADLSLHEPAMVMLPSIIVIE